MKISRAEISQEQFWTELLRTYDELKRWDGGSVLISELRTRLSKKLQLRKPSEFDILLRKLMKGEHVNNILLFGYGTPEDEEERRDKGFIYNGQKLAKFAIDELFDSHRSQAKKAS